MRCLGCWLNVYWLILSVKHRTDRSHAPRGHAFRDALRHLGTQSVPSGVTTQSVGTIKR
ncbi:hypothetical protein METHPM2_1170010 [Pseudomonas sp. PM2]